MIETSYGWMPKPGCLANGNWADAPAIGADLKHHRMLMNGMKLLPLWMRNRQLLPEHEQAKDRVLTKYAEAGHVVPWKFREMGFPNVVSGLDVIEQNGNFRLILDARYVNGAVFPHELTLPSVNDILDNLKTSTWMAKMDLKTGYHQMGLDKMHWGNMCFEWHETIWCFTVTTMGTRDAPGAFQKVTRTIAEGIELKFPDVRVEVYLDDFILFSDATTRTEISKIVEFMSDKGVVLGADKCSTEWSQQVTGLGHNIDVVRRRVTLTPQREGEIKAILQLLAEWGDEPVEIQRLSVWVGKILSSVAALKHLYILARPIVNILAITLQKHPDLFNGNRELGWEKLAIRRHYSGKVALDKHARYAAEYILRNWERLCVTLFEKRTHVTVAIDASDFGVGGFLLRGVWNQAGAPMSSQEKHEWELRLQVSESIPLEFIGQSSLCRECYAVYRVLENLKQHIRGCGVTIITDNEGLRARFVRGFSHSRTNEFAFEIAKNCVVNNILLEPLIWVPRALNAEADRLSRNTMIEGCDLEVSREWFRGFLSRTAEEEKPNVDAFASEANRKCDRYATIEPRMKEGAILDGFSVQWQYDDVLWSFPPPALARKAWQQWNRSSSKLMYLCVLKPQEGMDLWKLSNTVENIGEDVEVLGACRKFVVLKCRK